MFFLMKNTKDNGKVVWTYYWTKNRNRKWANGQSPPLLDIEDLRTALKEFDELWKV